MKNILPYEDYHKRIDNIEYKKCSICEGWFIMNNENFYKNKKSPDGLYPYCKPCTKKKSKQWEKDNPEKRKVLQDKYNAKEHRKKQRYELNQRCRNDGTFTKWRRKNKEKVKYYNLKYSIHKHEITKEEWESCKNYFNNSCAYCGITEDDAKEQQGQYLHKEHVDHNGANDLSNCVPACKSCNSSKKDKDFIDWYNKDNSIYSEVKYSKIIKWLQDHYRIYLIFS